MISSDRPHVTHIAQSEDSVEVRVVGCSGWCSGELIYSTGGFSARFFVKVDGREVGIVQRFVEETAYGPDREVLAGWLTKKMREAIWSMKVDAIVAEVNCR